MTDKKTCGTCGPDDGPCEYLENTAFVEKNCSALAAIDKTQNAYPECEMHTAFREQRERAESAEARVAELEGAIREAFEYAANRWSEWGSRAEGICEILERVMGWSDD